MSWVLADDVARGCLLALDHGVSGERYMLDGRYEDVCSIAEACNRAREIAGLEHRVEDISSSDDPELAAIFGPTLIAVASLSADEQRPLGTLPESKTAKRLGYEPVSLDDGLRLTIGWLGEIGRLE